MSNVIKDIREVVEIDLDILEKTKKVELFEDEEILMKVYIGDCIFSFTTEQLLTQDTLKMYLISAGRYLDIDEESWGIIVKHWLDMGETVKKPNKEKNDD